MGTRLTRGLTLEKAREWTQEDRMKWITLITSSMLPQLQGKKRLRESYNSTSGEVAFKIPAKLTGKQYMIMPGVYCDVLQWGTGASLPSVVMCDLDLLEKGAKKLVKTLEKASE